MQKPNKAIRRGFSKRVTALSLILAATTAVIAANVLFNPPGDPAAAGVDATNILAFSQRDFVSASGYDQGDRVVVRVIHDQARYPGATGGTTGEASPDWISPDGDSDGDGINDIVEVNHPGGSCWLNQTPDIRPGDRVQIEVMANDAHPERVGRIDETYVRNVTAGRPVVVQDATDDQADGIVEVHGTAVEDTPGGAAGQLNEALLESRLVSPGNLFDLNGRRTLRATNIPGDRDGILTYDVPGSPDNFNWTARYTGLTSDDVKRATGADSRIHWLGNSALPAVESTIYEIGALTFAGPAAPCTAPLEVLPPPPGSELVPPSDPTNLTAELHGQNQIDLSWDASTDNVGVTSYGVYRNGQAIFTVQNQDGSTPAPTTFKDKNIPPGTYTYHVVAFDAVGNASGPSNETAGIQTTIQLGGTFPVPINDPPQLPINIIAFPSRDFISPSGYDAGDKVTVQLLRKGPTGDLQIVSSADAITPVEDAGTYLAEVNHPGGACWEGVTPEIRVGDIVRTIAYNPANETSGNHLGIRSIDQTTIAGVTAFQPVVTHPASPGNNDGVVEVHGTALGADGKPIPVDQIEQRMIATHGVGLWELNGRRALRASSVAQDGILAYDTTNNPTGVKWTATYSGLSENDVARMADADTRIHWLGRDPLLLNEATIFENAPGTNPPGPAGPGCTRPLETADEINPNSPSGLQAAVNDNQNAVTLSWTQAASPQDDWYVAGYRIFDNGAAIANAAADATSITLNDIAPGNHVFTVRAYDTASPRNGVGDIIARISAGLGNLYGNQSDPAAVSAVTNGTLGEDGGVTFSDILRPSTPNNFLAVASKNPDGGAFIDLTWDASTDNIGVVKYVVVRGSSGSGPGATFDPVNALTYRDTLDSAGARDYSVSACDAAGNCSVPATITVIVPDEFDGIVPTWPDGAVVTATNPDIHTGNVTITWTPASDNIDPSVARYDLFRVSNAINADPTGAAGEKIISLPGNTTTYSEVLQPGTYQYALIAVDSAGNQSVLSSPSNELVIANDVPPAPHSLIGFPARDFISATGYTVGDTYRFTVLRDNAVVYTSQDNTADATGTIEVNHPATPPQTDTCWLVNTPNLRAGDVIRILDTTTGIADQTTLYNVTAERPVVVGPLANTATNSVVIHGTAALGNGQPVPLAQIEQRLIANKIAGQAIELFDKNGRRDLRAAAGLDGLLAYDTVNNPTGTKWTATYTGLTLNDVYRIVGGSYTNAGVTKNYPGAESRAVWLGRAPLALVEATIFENGTGVTGGPSAPCVTPAEPAQPATTIAGNGAFGTQTFDPLTNTGLPSAPRAFTVSNGGSAELQIGDIYISGANPGVFSLVPAPAVVPPGTPASCGATLAAGASCSVWVQFTPTALGLHQAYVSVVGNGANTTDLSVALTGTGIEPNPPSIQFALGNTAPLTFNSTLSITNWSVNGGALTTTVNGGQVGTRIFTVKNSALAGSRSLTVSNAAFTGANLSDFSVSNNGCNGAVAPGATCSITVQFRPGARAARTATLVLTHTAVANGSTTSSIPVSGTGGNGAVLSFNSNPVTFGTVNRGTTKDQTISVKNSGNQTAALSAARFAVTGAGFTFRSTTCGNLTANSSCSVVVRFTAPNTLGAFVGSLTVNVPANGLPTSVTTSLSASTK